MDPPPTVRELVTQAAAVLGVAPRLRVTGPTLTGLLSRLVPPLRELRDIREQFEQPFRFASGKIARELGLYPTPLAEGLARALRG